MSGDPAVSEQEWRDAINTGLGGGYWLRELSASVMAAAGPLIKRVEQQARQEALREALDIVSKKLRLYGPAGGVS